MENNSNINNQESKERLLSSKLQGIYTEDRVLYADYPYLPDDELEMLKQETLNYFPIAKNILEDLNIPAGRLLTIQQVNLQYEGDEYPEVIFLFTFTGLGERAREVAYELDLALSNDDYGFESFTYSQSGQVAMIVGKIDTL